MFKMSQKNTPIKEKKQTKTDKINKAIDELQTFLECDLYSRFRPEQILPIGKKGKKEKWFRDANDVFLNEEEFLDYLRGHFDIFREKLI